MRSSIFDFIRDIAPVAGISKSLGLVDPSGSSMMLCLGVNRPTSVVPVLNNNQCKAEYNR